MPNEVTNAAVDVVPHVGIDQWDKCFLCLRFLKVGCDDTQVVDTRVAAAAYLYLYLYFVRSNH